MIFVGDAGTTEAGRPSHRYGVEWANYYSPRPWLAVDGDVSVSGAHVTDGDPAGNLVPGAVAAVLSGGVTVNHLGPVFGSLRWRYFGPRALVEDRSSRSKTTNLLNLDTGSSFSGDVASRSRSSTSRTRRTATSIISTRHACRANRPAASTKVTSIPCCRARRA